MIHTVKSTITIPRIFLKICITNSNINITFRNIIDFTHIPSIKLINIAAISIPNIIGSAKIPALLRFNVKNYFQNICESLPNSIKQNKNFSFSLSNLIVSDYIEINSPASINHNMNLDIYNSFGEIVFSDCIQSFSLPYRINTDNFFNGTYLIKLNYLTIRFTISKRSNTFTMLIPQMLYNCINKWTPTVRRSLF